MNPLHDSDIEQWLGGDSLLGSDAVNVRGEFATSSVNEQPLLLAIRHAVGIGRPLPPRQVGGRSENDGEKFGALAPGVEIEDFRLIKLLGAGSFARVFLASHNSMQRLVAIKFSIRPSNEPKLLSILNHPHIVRVYHYDAQYMSEEGIYVLVMEYVPGVDLKRLLRDAASVPIGQRSAAWLESYLSQTVSDSQWGERLAMPPQLAGATWAEVVAWISARIADALSYAHRQNVVHRDLKPANVLLRADGSPMLVDFNVGFGEHVLGARPRDNFGGSPPYMAPEQHDAFYGRGDIAAVDSRCDIYSLGVLLYELLTGALPDTQGKTIRPEIPTDGYGREAVAGESHVETESAGGLDSCPVGLRNIVSRCLAGDASNRPQSAEFVARKLQICSSRELHDFVFVPVGSWAAMVSRNPLLWLVAFALLPNAFFAALNIAFVDQYVSEGFYRDVPPDWTVAIRYFTLQKIVVNAVVFPLGLYAVACLARPFVRGFLPEPGWRSGSRQPPVRSAAPQIAWQHASRLGNDVWIVALGCWAATGFIFPTWNWLAKLHYTSEPLLLRDFATFLMTQITFGSMASALSVLGVNFVLTRRLLSVLVQDDYVPTSACLDPITNQVQRMVHWLAFLPQFSLLAVALLIEDRNWVLLALLGLVNGGCYGCGILYARSIRRAEGSLRILLAPTEELLYGKRS